MKSNVLWSAAIGSLLIIHACAKPVELDLSKVKPASSGGKTGATGGTDDGGGSGSDETGGTTTGGRDSSSGGETSSGGATTAEGGKEVGGASTEGGEQATGGRARGGSSATGGRGASTGGRAAGGAQSEGGDTSDGGALAAGGGGTAGGGSATGSCDFSSTACDSDVCSSVPTWETAYCGELLTCLEQNSTCITAADPLCSKKGAYGNPTCPVLNSISTAASRTSLSTFVTCVCGL